MRKADEALMEYLDMLSNELQQSAKSQSEAEKSLKLLLTLDIIDKLGQDSILHKKYSSIL